MDMLCRLKTAKREKLRTLKARATSPQRHLAADNGGMGKLLSHDSTHAPPLFVFSLICRPYKRQASLLIVEKRPPFRRSHEREKICSRSAPMCLPPQRSSRTYDLAKRRHTTVYSTGCTARLKYRSHRRKRSLLAPLAGKSSTPGNELSRVSAAKITPPLSCRRETRNTSSPLAVQGP